MASITIVYDFVEKKNIRDQIANKTHLKNNF